MEFDGLVAWPQYQHHLEFVAEINGWDQRTTLAHFVSKLRGRAQQFSAELEYDVLFDLQRLKQAFRERFDPGTPQSVFRNQLRTREQRSGESLADFAVSIQSLARAAYAGRPQDMVDEMAVEQFLAGIRDVDIQIATRDRAPTTLIDARNVAITLTQNRRFARMNRRTYGTNVEVRAANVAAKIDSQQQSSGNDNGST